MRENSSREDNIYQQQIDQAFALAEDFADKHSALSLKVKTCSQDVQQPIQESEPLGIELLDLLKTFKQILDSLNVKEYRRAVQVVPAIIDKFREIKRKCIAAKAALKREPDSPKKTNIRQSLKEVIEKIERVVAGLQSLQKAIKEFFV